MFNPGERHCTTCNTVDPETDDDGETDCCTDTVCTVDADGYCDRCNPKCAICGFECLDGWEIDARRRQIHPERKCTEALDKASAAAKKSTKPAAKKSTDAPIVVKEMKIVGVRGAHAECNHPATKSARAACRRAKNAGK